MKWTLLLIFSLIPLTSFAKDVVNESVCTQAAQNDMQVRTKTGVQKISVVDYATAQKLFNELKKRKYKIPYRTSPGHSSSCVYRAHRISMILKEKFGIDSLKSFVEADLSDEDLLATAGGQAEPQNLLQFTDKRNGDAYSWDFHTAPVICVRHRGRLQLFSMDLTLFEGPVTHSTWIKSLTKGRGRAYYGSNYLTTMYNMVQVRSPNAPPQLAFTKSDRKITKQVLRADMKVHRQLSQTSKSKSSSKRAEPLR